MLTVVAFVLGWFVSRISHDDEGPKGAKSASPSPSAVHLELDAGGITLLPEGGLHLEPIEPLDGGLPDP